MSKQKYNSLVVEEAVGFDDLSDDVLDASPIEQDTDALLSVSLATEVYGCVQRVDHLRPDGLWVHGAIGV